MLVQQVSRVAVGRPERAAELILTMYFCHAGMQTQLGLTNTEYSLCLTITYISFIFAEWPSVMFCKKL